MQEKGLHVQGRGGSCDFILVTGRPRGCGVEDCDQFVEGPKAVPKSEWVGGPRKPAHKIEIECETKGFEEAAEEIERIGDAISDFPPQVTVRNCDGCTINIYASQYPLARGGDDE